MAVRIQTQQTAIDDLIAKWEAKAKADGDEYVTRLNAHDSDANFYLGSSYTYGRVAKQLRRAVYGLTADEKLIREMMASVARGETAEQCMTRLLPMMLTVEEGRAEKR